MIEYSLVDSDFELLRFEDGKEKHVKQDPIAPIQFAWGLEKVLNRDLSDYFYFCVNRMNVEKGVVPGNAYVNGVLAESLEGEFDRGEYLLPRNAVKGPLEIRVESVRALFIRFQGIKQFPSLALDGEKVTVDLDSYEMSKLLGRDRKPVFEAFVHETGQPLALEGLEYSANAILPWIRFVMPNQDVDIRVSAALDETKKRLIFDDSALRGILLDGLVSEALYSDDYDFGLVDHDFMEGSALFPLGSTLKVEVVLSEEKKIQCLLDDVSYAPIWFRPEKRESYPNARRYRFDVKFEKEGKVSFLLG